SNIMTQYSSPDATKPVILLTLIENILKYTESSDKLGEALIKEVYEFSGSDAVLLIGEGEGEKLASHHVYPGQKKAIFDYPIYEAFLQAASQTTKITKWDTGVSIPHVSEMLTKTDLESCLVVPLNTEKTRVGTLVIFGARMTGDNGTLISTMEMISPILAQIIQNALIHTETTQVMNEACRNRIALEHEIRERKKTEEESQKSFDYYLKLFDEFPNPIWRSDNHAKCDYFNKEWLASTGRTIEQERGDGWTEGVHPEDFDRCLKMYLDNFQIQKPFAMEYRLRHRDGTYHWYLDCGKPFYDLKGEFAGYIGSCYDTTDRKQAEQALEQANKKIKILSSITRHDILNQINALILYLDLSRNSEKDPKILEYLNSGMKITESIGRQIDFTKYYENIGVTAPNWQKVPELIQSALSETLDMGQTEVHIHIASLEIFADALIVKVFYNFLENSLRHGEHVRRIEFFNQLSGDELSIVYTDDGIGISTDEKKNLFERGFGKHTGLGLFLSQEILSITNIRIQETGEPGKGVRFEIIVPKGMFRISAPGDLPLKTENRR
ncbi:MAG TPA: PAS domain-containing sensor histidine kinase, partial [Methanospirillum sp.]|nr:PAS domain-containing sensor histidine kinase [Methanospirillum sp.]